MQLVGARDQQHRRIDAVAVEVLEVTRLALGPGRLGLLEGVGTLGHEGGDRRAKAVPDRLQGRFTALILGAVVQEGGDSLVLVATVFQHDGAHRQQVRYIRGMGPFADLVTVQVRGEHQGVTEPGSQTRWVAGGAFLGHINCPRPLILPHSGRRVVPPARLTPSPSPHGPTLCTLTGTDEQPMWAMHRVGEGNSPLVIHVPHSGREIPVAERRHLLLGDAELDEEIARMTDGHTDQMAIDALGSSGVVGAVFVNHLSRLVVDPERLTDDSEPMSVVGMGAVYRVTSDLGALRSLGAGDEKRLLDRWFRPYAAAFSALVDQVLEDHGSAVIVDLHSFPSVPLPYELDPAALRPGVCIGTDAGHTPPELVAAAVDAFTGVRGGVAENTPFAGTYVPLAHWHRTPQVRSIMIEVRRDLYQTEPDCDLHHGYRDITSRLGSFLGAVLR